MGRTFSSMGIRGRVLTYLIFALHFTRAFPELFDTLSQGDFFTSRDEMTSIFKEFKMRFFHFPNDPNKNWYLGIPFRGQYVWIANLHQPIEESLDPKLVIDDRGSLKILYNGGSNFIVVYSSKVAQNISALAKLGADGSLRLYQINTATNTVQQLLWESFDYPNNIFLPGMRVGINNRTGYKRTITSMKGANTPSLGSFTLGMDPNNTRQLVMWWQGNIYWTSGALNDGRFSNLYTTSDMYLEYKSDENETYFTSPLKFPRIPFIGLNPLGQLFGDVSVSCNGDNPAHVSGCVPPKPPNCRNPEIYVSMLNFQHVNVSQAGYKNKETEELSLYDCGVRCLNDCSCVAYSSTTTNDTGCEMWGKETKFVASSLGRPVYFIQPQTVPQGTDNYIGGTSKAKMYKLWIGVAGGALVILISSYICYASWKKSSIKAEKRLEQNELLDEIEATAIPSFVNSKCGKQSYEMHIFSFENIAIATDNFSSANKLGEGGFGPVYKGKLPDGQEIAVKRLSCSSRQGLIEFKNEVKVIAKLQHTNLVKLRGFCIERGERMLIYEFLPNKSLDFYLFDPNNRISLDWKTRFGVIQGTAQGLVYLHKYSRLKVIHRDLKPSNILLDHEMNPKISDFGMAKIFGLKDSEQNTNRVVGTYGYMSPEYVLNGIVSFKTDVFSFGVLLLEIISGKKNTSCYHSDHPVNLIAYAWQLRSEGRALQLIDPLLNGSNSDNEMLRCIHIGLLCVQDRAKDRPTMLDVASFLSNEYILPVEPNPPTFFSNLVKDPKLPNDIQKNYSLNFITNSFMDGR